MEKRAFPISRLLLSRLLERSELNRRNNSTAAPLDYVPKHDKVKDHELQALQKLIRYSEALLIITGAGISTESGIPDYRSEGVGLYARTPHRPVQHKDFMTSESIRQRYWARNFVGWPRFSSVLPNEAHRALVRLEEKGKVLGIVTQNVDRLHTKAGSTNVSELHGTAFDVICMKCGDRTARTDLQIKLQEMNPTMVVSEAQIRPDGDVELSEIQFAHLKEQIEKFNVPTCQRCNAFLKPDIVFFGDNVPRHRVDAVYSQVDKCDTILVIGSSLQVYSGYRFLVEAYEQRKHIAILNIGPSRGDMFAELKIHARCGDVLSRVV